MSRATADVLLRLEPAAWRLRGPAGEMLVPLDGGPVEALAHFDAAATRGAGRLKVVLGDGVLRYLTLRWPDKVVRAAERRAWLLHRFQVVHDVAEPDWMLVSDRDAVGSTALACAVPRALVDGLHAFAAARGLRLTGIAGDFVDAYNTVQAGLDEARGHYGLLALARGGRVTAGLWRQGEWLAMRSQAHGPAVAAEVCRMLETWLSGAGPGPEAAEPRVEPGTLYAMGFAPVVPAGWRASRLKEPACA